MKNILSSRLFLALFSFALGVGSLVLYQKYFRPKPEPLSSLKNIDPLFDQFYNDSFFSRSLDPFESMRQMRKHMEKQFESPPEGGALFDSWFEKKFGGGTAEEIIEREDENYIYYDVKISGLNEEKLNVSVSNGQISISGEKEEKSTDKSNSYFRSSFHRSFPLPPNVDSINFQMEREKDKVIIKFPKIK